MRTYISAFKKILDYKGQATRAELFGFYGWNFVLLSAFSALSIVIGEVPDELENWSFSCKMLRQLVPIVHNPVVEILLYGYYLLAFLANLSLVTRRLHDFGKTGWWQLPLYILPLCEIGLFFLYMNTVNIGWNTGIIRCSKMYCHIAGKCLFFIPVLWVLSLIILFFKPNFGKYKKSQD